MTRTNTTYDRRSVLKAAGATAMAASVAGCSRVMGQRADGTTLLPPENHDRLEDVDLPFPTYGDELPTATVPAPLHDREVTTTEFVGERHTMLTFIYTSCTTVCPGLTATLRRVQGDAIEEGYDGEITFQAMTFDPEHDTADVLESYGRDMGVDFEVGNWYFLRPETPETAEEVVEDTFGVAFEGGGMDGGEMNVNSDEMNGDGEGAADDGRSDDDGDHDGHDRHFQHASLILLVNDEGIVERAYNGGPPNPSTVIEDVRTVVEA
ncbi:SCO family protein [Halopenitus sp. H-Gu1]|uniref:SCO family protein n=1 Tax=Halopenitus sp. H-Gu1 TaxID=3242697 RepID=UPI00359EC1EE